jgi:L,D-transpeptidase catalytic domain
LVGEPASTSPENALVFIGASMRLRGFVLACALAAAGLSARPAAANVLVTVDKSNQQMSVAVDGVPRWQWRVSTGRPNGYDTPSGIWRAFRMEADHFSKEFDDAPMPHSIFFTKLGHALHGYLDTRNLGAPVSHGCVRLDPENAAKLYALVEQQGVLNTTVVVTGNAAAAVARRRAPGNQPTEASIAAPAPAYAPYAPPSYEQPYRSSDERYAPPPSSYRSTDERYAPLRPYREPDDQYGYPPTPPPNYPPFPRPAYPYSNWR